MAQNNTYKHISDLSIYSVFNPVGTRFPLTVKTVQEALALTSPTAQATEQAAGTLKIATTAQVQAGLDDSTAVTPLKLHQRLQYSGATTTVKGRIAIATNAEAQAGTVSNKAVVPSSLKSVVDSTFTTRVSTEAANGVLKLSSLAAAKAGTDHTTAMTPLRVKQAIADATQVIPSYTPGSETVAGLMQLATTGQTEQGTLRAGFAVSPYGLAQLTGNDVRRGIVKAASIAEVNAGTDNSVYISAQGFRSYTATASRPGTVKLTNTPGVGDASTGLRYDAAVLRLSGPSQTVTGNVNIAGVLTVNSKPVLTEEVIEDNMPIGSILMWPTDLVPSNKWAICDGGFETKTNRPILFQRLSYRYGGSGENFARPDMRGLFVRGGGVSDHILRERGFDNKSKPKLGNGCQGGYAGEVQMQQMTEHKHASGWGEKAVSGYAESNYGRSANYGYVGSNKTDWDNHMWFTNDGTEIETEAQRQPFNTLNRKKLIGEEIRPWNMSLHYIIKVA